MATCGYCKTTGVDVAHVKACYSGQITTKSEVVVSEFASSYVKASDFSPMVFTNASELPDSLYALERADGLVFYELRTGRKGKWTGFKFLDRLVGAPGDWKRYAMKGTAKAHILAEIAENPAEAAGRYGREFTRCGVCHSPLSDPTSRALGIGPDCRKKF